MHYSRLARKTERMTQQQSALLIVASVVILILFAAYGFPAILNFAGTIGGLRGAKTTTTVDKGVTPATPRFAQDFEATKSAQITLHGVADSKVSVEISRNGQLAGTTIAKEDGTFAIDVSLSTGDNSFTAMAISDTGVKSGSSDSYTIALLTSPPKLEISSPKDGDSFKDSQVTISGKSDPGVAVSVNDHLAVVSGDGSFSYLMVLAGGDNKVKIVSTDKAGNQATKEITIKYSP